MSIFSCVSSSLAFSSTHPRFCMFGPDSISAILAKDVVNFSSFSPQLPGLQAQSEEPLVPRTIYTWHGGCSYALSLSPLDLWLSNVGFSVELTLVTSSPFLSLFFQWLCVPFWEVQSPKYLVLNCKSHCKKKKKSFQLKQASIRRGTTGALWRTSSSGQFSIEHHTFHACTKSVKHRVRLCNNRWVNKRRSLDCRLSDHSSGWLCVDV